MTYTLSETTGDYFPGLMFKNPQRIKRVLQAFLLVFFLVPPIFNAVPAKSEASTYFVDATNGNDSNDGKSPEKAFRSLAMLAGFPFNPGDTILLKRDEVWRETWYINTGGSPGNPITYGAYGTGERPRVTGSEYVTGWSLLGNHVYRAAFVNSIDIYLLIEDYSALATRVESLSAITGPKQFWFDDQNNTVYYWASDGADPNSHIIEIGARYQAVVCDGQQNITFENLQFDGAGGKYGSGFAVESTSNTPTNITIRNSIIRSNYYAGILASSKAEFPPIKNFLLDNTEIDHNGVFGVRITSEDAEKRISGLRIQNSNIHDNGLDRTSIGQFGIWLKNVDSPIIINNQIHDNQGFLNWSGNLYIGSSPYAVVQFNTVYNGFRSNIHFDGNSNGFEASYNVVYGAFWNGIFVEEHLKENGTSRIYNNTVVGNMHGFAFGPGVSPKEVSGVIVRNNVFAYNTRASTDLNNVTNDNDVDNNLYFVEPSAQGQFRAHNQFMDFDTWKSISGWDTHSIFADPMFRNLHERDFHLQPDSPAINSGENVGLLQDKDNRIVPQSNQVDMGAFEFSDSFFPIIHNPSFYLPFISQ